MNVFFGLFTWLSCLKSVSLDLLVQARKHPGSIKPQFSDLTLCRNFNVCLTIVKLVCKKREVRSLRSLPCSLQGLQSGAVQRRKSACYRLGNSFGPFPFLFLLYFHSSSSLVLLTPFSFFTSPSTPLLCFHLSASPLTSIAVLTVPRVYLWIRTAPGVILSSSDTWSPPVSLWALSGALRLPSGPTRWPQVSTAPLVATVLVLDPELGSVVRVKDILISQRLSHKPCALFTSTCAERWVKNT